MKIIIVDDEILVRKGIATSIEWGKIGITDVFEASNGEQALEKILENDINIVLTDIKMPRMDGLELIERLRVIKSNAVVIVLSCVNDMEYVRKALKFGGALDYVSKLSMTTEELRDIIKRAKEYAISKKEIEISPVYINLPHFFKLEYEEQLRSLMEYGIVEDMILVIEKIFEEASILGTDWRNSREWYDIIGLFSSIVKKHHTSIEQFFPGEINIEEIIDTAQEISYLKRYILEMAISIKGFLLKQQKINYDEHIYKAINYINNNYQNNIKLKDVAEDISISATYLSRLFKKVMQINFVDYINRVRIRKAKELLETKRFTIQEIADQIGYRNASYFTQVFRDIEGITPKQYQQKNI